MKLTTVQQAIISWNTRFNTGYKPRALRMLVEEYLEDLVAEDVTDRQFCEAAKLVRRRCRFFPRMVEVLECVQEIRNRPAQASDCIQITENPTYISEYDSKRNAKRLDLLVKATTGEMPYEDVARLLEEMNTP